VDAAVPLAIALDDAAIRHPCEPTFRSVMDDVKLGRDRPGV
jgi:hypothetical protein